MEALTDLRRSAATYGRQIPNALTKAFTAPSTLLPSCIRVSQVPPHLT